MHAQPEVLAEGPVALFHRIVDAMVDHYRPEVEKLEDRLDELEDAVFERPRAGLIRRDPGREARGLALRRIVTPQRDVIARLARREFVDISTEMSFRFRDVYDHWCASPTMRLMFQDRITGMLEAHLTNASNRLNEVMKVLTVMSTDLHAADAAVRHLGHEHRRCRISRAATPRSSGGCAGIMMAADRPSACSCHVPPPDAGSDGSSSMGKITPSARRTSRTRSPPAKSSSVRPRSSRSWSRTPSTPARAALAIHVELGGKKQVRVEDDGEGMEPDDARLAIERHATSKIRRADDLAAILTLGFRGEALPSIASVSHFVLRTRARGQQSGTEIRVNGGVVASSVEVGGAGRHRRSRSTTLLQPAGAAEVPEVRRRRIGAGLARRRRSWRWRIRRSASR